MRLAVWVLQLKKQNCGMVNIFISVDYDQSRPIGGGCALVHFYVFYGEIRSVAVRRHVATPLYRSGARDAQGRAAPRHGARIAAVSIRPVISVDSATLGRIHPDLVCAFLCKFFGFFDGLALSCRFILFGLGLFVESGDLPSEVQGQF